MSVFPHAGETEDVIRQRMLDKVDPRFHKQQGSFIYDSLSPAAVELAQLYIRLREIFEWSFIENPPDSLLGTGAFGEYLDKRAEESGLTRRPAAKARGVVRVTGSNGTVIPVGTVFSTVAEEGVQAIFFVSVEQRTIVGGVADVPVEAKEAGADGNIPAGTVVLLVSSIPGVASVTNLEAFTGGLDQETDEELRARLLQLRRNPPAGGNVADYLLWAASVSEVGGVSVIPVRDGPGTVTVVIINTNREPADQALVDAVQDYIAPPWVNVVQAESFTLSGYGVSLDDQPDDYGQSVKMVYDAAGEGQAVQANVLSVLQKPGIWQARVRVKVDGVAGSVDLLQVGMWNVSAASWALQRPGGASAVVTFRASDLSTSFVEKVLEFYSNGEDILELRITRLASDQVTAVWVDQVEYRSTFSKDTGEGKAPIGARVTVQAAVPVYIDVSATLVIAPGYSPDAVKQAVESNIRAYIKSVAFATDNDVRYVRVGQAILDTPGVSDYLNLLVNGGTVNVAVGPEEVAVLRSVVLS